MKAFIKLISITMQQKMYYRVGFLLNLTAPLILLGSQLLLWGAIYRGTDTLGSMSRPDMYSYMLLAFMINSLLTWSSENELSREIRSGAVVARRMRPVPFLWQSLAGMCGNLVLQAAVNVALVAVGFLFFGRYLTTPSLVSLPPFLLSLALGVLLRMMLVSFFSLLCFFTTGYLGLTWTRTALMEFFSGALIPVALFPGWLMTISYCTPFPLMLQAPVAIFLGQPLPMPLWSTFALQIGWTLVFFALHETLYHRVRKTATVAGG